MQKSTKTQEDKVPHRKRTTQNIFHRSVGKKVLELKNGKLHSGDRRGMFATRRIEPGGVFFFHTKGQQQSSTDLSWQGYYCYIELSVSYQCRTTHVNKTSTCHMILYKKNALFFDD